MKKLLSLPPNLVGCFHEVTGLDPKEYFCTNDPVGHKLGSGGGTTWLLEECHRAWSDASFDEWLSSDRKILLHAGGQSRRLPSYAPSGKILTPIPVFRWERGQRLDQDLLRLQLPLYERLMKLAPDNIHTMIVSGDVYIRAAEQLPPVPDADVVCYGLWLDSSIATDHGVFVSDRRTPSVLKQMLQKPSVETLNGLLKDHFYLTDIGVWMLSDRAVKLLMERSKSNGQLKCYDLYSEFGCALGTDPTIVDEELRNLKVAILPLPGGEFYHYGTSHEMISSTLAVQNIVNDQREIMHHGRKPHPSIFVQNAYTGIKITADNTNLWIENSHVGKGWTISHDNIITGVPENDWTITLKAGQCVDIVPIGDQSYVLRPYNMDDKFAGAAQQTPMFPVLDDIEEMGRVLCDMLAGTADLSSYKLMSAEEISNEANLVRLVQQRKRFCKDNWKALADNHEHSVFYQLDLDHAARQFAENGVEMPKPISEHMPLLTRIHDAMFRSELSRLTGAEHQSEEQKAFSLLREGLTESVLAEKQSPKMSVYSDQIVWGRSPVRIDLAGGWTDTPPYCLMEGGNVINIAIELNGQPPLQTYIRPSKQPHIICRSIDLGAVEVIETYEELADFMHVGSPFSIPKAALALAGFLPGFSNETYPSLRAQLESFGCGIELTLLSAIPAGSGLGTSSILAATVLGAINDFCSLAWDKSEIGRRTLVLEQLLTTGGGWQDQFGGVLGGVKLLQTQRGFEQTPLVRWLPDEIYTQPEYAQCHLLYYTGITRTAKNILSEIVRRMFLNHNGQLQMLREMKAHALDMYEAIQRNDFNQLGLLVGNTWQQNQAIDIGTNPPAVKALTDLVDDLCLGYKLPGAGGGGYLYMVAKDPEAAVRIKQILNAQRNNPNARFVEMSLSKLGLQVSRS
ncbi:MAG: bifunctional fucokinase/L-fucose-1-P-guanylyltransferase [Prevotella sp.]|nr:bifunctional fucokinase/L-fucose-1-P-guanylyltransferase [Prevotella sp.]